jgi:polysaccharide biosynthesis/export protein
MAMKGKALVCFFVAFSWFALAGCAHRKAPVVPFEDRAQGMYPGQDDGRYVDYRIGIGDELEIVVARHKEFEGKTVVEASGSITLPKSLDRVKAIGLTVSEVEDKIGEALAPYFISRPRVNVRVATPNSRFVYIIGAVHQPGKIVMSDERLDLREAIYRAGQPTEVAALTRVKLISSGPNRAEARKVNLKRLLYRGELEENFELKPGDVIYVPNLYFTDLSWWLIHILRPFQILVNYEETADDISHPDFSGNGGGRGYHH